jgi:hypothetical protein
MANINTINLLVIRDLIQRAEEANKEANQAKRITRLSQVFKIGADQPLFNLIVQQQLMADEVSSRLAQIEEQGGQLNAIATEIQAAVRQFEAQRAALFANDRIRSLLRLYWPWLALAAWFFTMAGFIAGFAVLARA